MNGKGQEIFENKNNQQVLSLPDITIIIKL